MIKKMEEKKKNGRVFYLDILRVIACLSVIMIHTSAPYVVKDIGTFNFWVGNIFDSLVRIGVPIFIMISGALMLDKNYEYETKKLIKHIIRMIIFFIFWSVLYCVIFEIIDKVIINNGPLSIKNIFINIIEGHYHLWYIYMIIGLYLLVPLLRLWVYDKNKKYVEYFIILSIIFTYIIPQIISIGSNYYAIFNNFNNILQNKLCLTYVGGYTTYFILGWYINNYEIKYKKIIYALGLIGLIITILGTYFLSSTLGRPLQMYGRLDINVLFQSIAVFVFIKTSFKNIKDNKNKIINSISKYSLGIYAIHVLILTYTYRILESNGFNNSIINIPLVFIISFLLSYLISFIFSKIPFLNKMV